MKGFLQDITCCQEHGFPPRALHGEELLVLMALKPKEEIGAEVHTLDLDDDQVAVEWTASTVAYSNTASRDVHGKRHRVSSIKGDLWDCFC